MKKFERVSASQIASYTDCARAWWHEKILGIEKPQKASAQLGEAVHTQLEKYLTDGTLPDDTEVGRIAKAGLAYLPPVGSGAVELEMAAHEAGPLVLSDLPVIGYVDYFNLNSKPPLLLDHKTTSSLKYALNAEQLNENIQLNIYAGWGFKVLDHIGQKASFIRAGHIVYLTKGRPVAKRTEVDITRSYNEDRLDELAGIVDAMKQTALIRDPGEVPANYSACDKYGGCHFKGLCAGYGRQSAIKTPTAETTVKRDKKEPPMGNLLDLLQKRASGPSTDASISPPDAPEDVTPAQAKAGAGALFAGVTKEEPKTESKPSAILAAITGKKETAPVVEAPVEAAKPKRRPQLYKETLLAQDWSEAQISRMTVDAVNQAIDEKLRPQQGYSVLKNGDLYKHPPREGDTVEDIVERNHEMEERVAIVEIDGNGSPEVAEALALAQITASAQAPGKPQPAAPTNAPNNTPSKTTEKPSEPAAPKADRRRRPESVKNYRFVLYIDCAPIKGSERMNYELLEEILAPSMRAVEDAKGLAHYSLVPYGQGAKEVAGHALRTLLDRLTQDDADTVIVANTRFPATDAVIESLMPIATTVVRGW